MKGKEKIIILVVLVLLCGALVLALTTKDKKKKDDSDNKDNAPMAQSTTISYDSASLPDDEIAKNLMERIQDYDLLDTFESREGLSNQQVLSYAVFILNYNDNRDIPGDEIKEAINKYFKVEYTNEDINCVMCEEVLYKYDSATNTYKYNPEHMEHAIDYKLAENTIEKYDSHSEEDGIYSMTVYKAFSNIAVSTSVPFAYYGAYQGGAKLFEIEYDLEKPTTDIIGEFRKVDNEKLTKVTYKFTKNSEGILVLVDRIQE